MPDKTPLVSIGMPAHNSARWIGQTLASLLNQTLTDFELIISDDASTDDTWIILQNYAARDVRISLYQQTQNIKAIPNFRFVLSKAKGEYFMWAGDHDLWSPNLLECLVNELMAHSQAVLCMANSVQIDEDGIEGKDFETFIDTRKATSPAGRILTSFRQPKRGNAFYGLYRREVLMQTLPWPKVAGIDLIILARVASLGNILTIPTARWYRRKNRRETANRKQHRQVMTQFELSGMAVRFPELVFRITLLLEFAKAQGSWLEKVALFKYGLIWLFFESGHFWKILHEFIKGCLAALGYNFGQPILDPEN